jgi:hypothetical protein
MAAGLNFLWIQAMTAVYALMLYQIFGSRVNLGLLFSPESHRIKPIAACKLGDLV